MKQIHLIDSTGGDWYGPRITDEEMAANAEDVLALFRDFGNIGNLSLECGGETYYFNPANVLAVAIVEA